MVNLLTPQQGTLEINYVKGGWIQLRFLAVAVSSACALPNYALQQ